MSTAASALWASITRTFVPIIVGSVVAFFVSAGVTLDAQFESALATLLAGAFSGAYYLIVRVLETYVTPKFGVLLGLAKTPAAYTAESPARHLA